MMQQDNYKYFAFISYNSKDTEWGKRIQKKLESYKMPATLCSEHGWDRKPIKPIFFAPTDIQPGGLTEELQERLKASRNLIVICSPHSAKSEWVGKEIEYFHSIGRTKQIHFFIVEGTPHSSNSETECFNPIVDSLGLPEILGANIHEQTQTYPFTSIPWPWLNKERAYVQLISKLLGVEFDSIWRRHRRQLIQKTIAGVLSLAFVLSVLFFVWLTNQPVDVSIRLKETSIQNSNLPPLQNAIITLTLNNESKIDTITDMDRMALFTNIPHRYLNDKVRSLVKCKDFTKVDTTIVLKEKNIIEIRRDESVYGNVHFLLWNPIEEKCVSNCELSINNEPTRTNSSGYVTQFIPLNKQKTRYHIAASVPLETDSIYMPCGKDDVILTK